MLDRSQLSDGLNDEVNQIIEWGTEMLERDIFPRSDYKQLLELTIIFLGGYVYPFTNLAHIIMRDSCRMPCIFYKCNSYRGN